MTVHVNASTEINASETISTSAAGGGNSSVQHKVSRDYSGNTYHERWSQRLTVTEAGTTYDMIALAMASLAAEFVRDLVTGQRLVAIGINNVGDNDATVEFLTAADAPIANGKFPVRQTGSLQLMAKGVEIFDEVPLKFTLQAASGGGDTTVDILLATEPTA